MNKLRIRAIGRVPEPWQKEAVDMYVDRLKPLIHLEIVELPEGHKGSAKPDVEKTRQDEATSLLKGIPSDDVVVALDETGKLMDSPAFAQYLTQTASPVTFLIGGSWGLSDEARSRADLVLSLGKMTLPHGLARVVLLEQLFRAQMIRSGKPYHK